MKVEANSLLVDIGCEMRVIGDTVVKGEGTQPSDRKLRVKTGHRLGHYGWKRVPFEGKQGQSTEGRTEVTDLDRGIP